MFSRYESPDRLILYGFLRLRLSDNSGVVFPELKNTALIRELHVYGNVVPVNKRTDENRTAQHMGFGKKLMIKAEEIAIEHNFTRIAVIAGVGVRPYYRKLGYNDEGMFQIKNLTLPKHSLNFYISKIYKVIFYCILLVICYFFLKSSKRTLLALC